MGIDIVLYKYVWVILRVGSEHILWLHREPQTADVAYHLGHTVELVSGRHRQATWVAWQWLLLMLTKLEMPRLIVQMLLPWIFCTGTSSHEESLLGSPAITYTQSLWTLAKTEFESWVLMKQVWVIYLGSLCYLFYMLIVVLHCGKPAEQE